MTITSEKISEWCSAYIAGQLVNKKSMDNHCRFSRLCGRGVFHGQTLYDFLERHLPLETLHTVAFKINPSGIKPLYHFDPRAGAIRGHSLSHKLLLPAGPENGTHAYFSSQDL